MDLVGAGIELGIREIPAGCAEGGTGIPGEGAAYGGILGWHKLCGNLDLGHGLLGLQLPHRDLISHPNYQRTPSRSSRIEGMLGLDWAGEKKRETIHGTSQEKYY